jgi:hypothetical protein
VKVYGLFSFEEPTVTEMIYLDMVEGLCHSWMKTVMATSFNKTAVHLTTTEMCEGITIEIWHKDG